MRSLPFVNRSLEEPEKKSGLTGIRTSDKLQLVVVWNLLVCGFSFFNRFQNLFLKKKTHEVILRQQKNLPGAFRQVLVTFTEYFSFLVLF